MLKQKKIPWDNVVTVMATSQNTTTELILTSTYRQALERACLDRSIQKSPRAMKMALNKMMTLSAFETEQQVKLLLSAVRCHNNTASQLLIENNTFVLYWQDIRSNTVLHLACEQFGWNDGIACLFQATMQHASSSDKEHTNNNNAHDGMFQCNQKGKSPLRLSLEAGGEISDVVDYLKAKHLEYFETHVIRLPEIIAEYCEDVSILRKLIEAYPHLLQMSDKNNYTLLHHACYYQNNEMIQLLLQVYSGRGERQRKLSSRLLVTNAQDMSPLAYLILGLGSMDAGNVLECLRICTRFVRQLPVLHLAIEKVWNKLREKKNCFKTISRIVEELGIDVSSIDHGKTALVLLIIQLASFSRYNLARGDEDKESEKVLEYILSRCETVANQRDSKKRLPLHIACESGLQWHPSQVLDKLVKANVSALEIPHPKSGLFPFALSASCATPNLNTIYQLLRCNPGVLQWRNC